MSQSISRKVHTRVNNGNTYVRPPTTTKRAPTQNTSQARSYCAVQLAPRRQKPSSTAAGLSQSSPLPTIPAMGHIPYRHKSVQEKIKKGPGLSIHPSITRHIPPLPTEVGSRKIKKRTRTIHQPYEREGTHTHHTGRN